MRLIDADALGIGRYNPDVFLNTAYAAGWNGVINIIRSAPTIDAVVVLPCKVGDTVYEPICDHVEAWPVESFEIKSDMVARPCYYNCGEIISCGFEDGDIFQVFLTRAEAEAALDKKRMPMPAPAETK